MQARNPIQTCGAKTRSGEACKQAAMPNGRCRMHGGTNPGAPIVHGRRSKYIRVFGEQFNSLVSDPDILSCNIELALFDQFLTERIGVLQDGFSTEWVSNLRSAVGDLRLHLLEEPDEEAAKAAFATLEEQAELAGERVAAWTEVLDAAKTRAEVAVKADRVLARRETLATETNVTALLVRILEIVANVAGPDIGRKVTATVERDIFGRVGQGASSPANAAPGTAN